MTTEQFRDCFRPKAEVWLRAQKMVKVMKMQNGLLFGVATIENHAYFPSKWNVLFDRKFNIFKIINFAENSINHYQLEDFAFSSKQKVYAAIFLGDKLGSDVFCFNEKTELVIRKVYQQLYVYFDENNAMRIILGLSYEYNGTCYQKTPLATFPLQQTSSVAEKSFSVCPNTCKSDDLDLNPISEIVQQEKEEKVLDIADCDLNDQEILLYYAERGFA